MSLLTCIDLFSGCGGFTLGMMRAGFRVLAAVDVDSAAISSLRVNLVARRQPGLIPVANALVRDLTTFRPSQLAELIGTDSVDVIVGGPPCQGFSTVRQVDGANHGARLKDDPRRRLYKEFLRYVGFFQPRVFVIENVLGIRTAAGGEYFTRMQKEARVLGADAGRPGYRVHSQIEDAWQLGVPQKRRRQIIIGLRNDLPGYFPSELKPVPRAKAQPCLGEAIGDLPILRAGGCAFVAALPTVLPDLREHLTGAACQIRIRSAARFNLADTVCQIRAATAKANSGEGGAAACLRVSIESSRP